MLREDVFFYKICKHSTVSLISFFSQFSSSLHLLSELIFLILMFRSVIWWVWATTEAETAATVVPARSCRWWRSSRVVDGHNAALRVSMTYYGPPRATAWPIWIRQITDADEKSGVNFTVDGNRSEPLVLGSARVSRFQYCPIILWFLLELLNAFRFCAGWFLYISCLQMNCEFFKSTSTSVLGTVYH